MIELKDYLHYYLNCRVKVANERYIDGGYIGTILGVTETQLLVDTGSSDGWEDIKYCAPILRPLSDITDEEKIEMFDAECSDVSRITTIKKKIKFVDEWLLSQRFGSASFHYLLKQGFDLFSLIENGLAIDKKTLKLKS